MKLNTEKNKAPEISLTLEDVWRIMDKYKEELKKEEEEERREEIETAEYIRTHVIK